MSGAVDAAAYLPFGPVRQIAFANGTTQALSYDARYRVTENKLSTATATLARYTYAYDAAGNITAITDASTRATTVPWATTTCIGS